MKSHLKQFRSPIIIHVFITQSEHHDPSRSVILTGFMGAGKTTVGRILSRLMRREFYDLDDILANQVGADVFEKLLKAEEASFRETETRVALELLNKRRAVVSFGGGTLSNPNVLNKTLAVAFLVYLKAKSDILLSRISQGDRQRPLIGKLGRDGLLKLLTQREPVYEQANLTVFTDVLEPEFVAKVIQHGFRH